MGRMMRNLTVTKFEDFKPCTVISVSEEGNVDLATTQLDDCEMPENSCR